MTSPVEAGIGDAVEEQLTGAGRGDDVDGELVDTLRMPSRTVDAPPGCRLREHLRDQAPAKAAS